jgi:hypothetical protein
MAKIFNVYDSPYGTVRVFANRDAIDLASMALLDGMSMWGRPDRLCASHFVWEFAREKAAALKELKGRITGKDRDNG